MKKIFLLYCLLPFCCFAQNAKPSKAEAEIRRILSAQTTAWNSADLLSFMNGYWQSDSLTFIGKSGMNKGWNKTLENYQKSYPTPEKMGKLDFTILKIEFLNDKNAYVIGKWHLARNFSEKTENVTGNNDLQGHFTLVWKKIKGKWLIISDHSS